MTPENGYKHNTHSPTTQIHTHAQEHTITLVTYYQKWTLKVKFFTKKNKLAISIKTIKDEAFK